MPLEAGTRLGPYEIAAQIGEGGMGEVYQATDTKLKRQVAIKVLPESVAADAERLARFQREAEVLASLNHPNTAAIYGLEDADGIKALVMELVEGPTLADRIAQGAIPVDEALPIAKQIAEALEAAHEQGIIHRDLKPANVKVRSDGTVKVLDFGLAKALEPTGAMSSEMSQAPTITTPAMTQAGMILGTAAYMSPEQAKGKTVDKRSDVWAFGAVLYEMLSGQRVFPGSDTSEVLAGVIKSEPDWDLLPLDTPSLLLMFLKQCLKKDAEQRVGDIRDVRLALEGAFETGVLQAPASVVVSQPAVWRRPIPVALLTAAVIGLAVWGVMRPAPQPPAAVSRLSIPLAAQEVFTGAGRRMVAISPNGRHVAYTANEGLALRPVDQLRAQPVPGTDGARNPFFSPDGQQIGFYADGQLKRVSVSSGTPVTVTEAVNPSGATWGADDMVLYGQGPQGIWRVSGAGGTPEQVIPVGDGELAQGPQLLPGGEWVLFTLRPIGVATWDESQIVMQSLTTDERIVLIDGGRDARYLPTGHLVYGLDDVLLAVPFDLATRQVTGGAVPLVEGVAGSIGVTGGVQFAVAATGALVYVPGTRGVGLSLVWVDREGQEEVISAESQEYRRPRVSPDGTRVAVDVEGSDGADVWIWHLVRETPTRLTFDAGVDRNPIWTPDGARVVFSSGREGGGLFWKAADGTGAVERLLEHPFAAPYAWTADGRLIFDMGRGNPRDLGVLALEGNRTADVLLDMEFDEVRPALSPGGRWLAYVSNESGQNAIYVRPFPNVDDGKWQVSTGNATSPVWSPDGQELFYREGDSLMAVPVDTEQSFTYDRPQSVFSLANYFVFPFGRDYDISPDGQRFVFFKAGEPEPGEDVGPPQLIVVQNWFEELRRLAPTD